MKALRSALCCACKGRIIVTERFKPRSNLISKGKNTHARKNNQTQTQPRASATRFVSAFLEAGPAP